LVAAIVGAGLAENENLFGAIAAFGLVLLALALQRQRAELSQAQRDLAALRARVAGLVAATATPSPASTLDESPGPAAESASWPKREDVGTPAAPARDSVGASPRPPPL